MKIGTICCGCVLSCALLPALPAHAQATKTGQDQPKPPPGMEGMTPEQMEKMAEWMKIAAPSEHHQALNHFVGDWNVTTKMWMGGPGTPAAESQGTSTVRWIMDGRFVREEFRGQFMGQAYEGQGTLGYDNYKNMYITTWLDNQSTSMYMSKGSKDPSGKVFTFYGEMDEPMLDVQDRMVRHVVRIVNENKHVFEMYDLHAGPDYKVMEFVYTRK